MLKGQATRRAVKESLEANPTQTLQQVADQTGITRERVSQITKELGLSQITPVKYGRCPECNKPFVAINASRLHCYRCHPWRKMSVGIALTCDQCDVRFHRRLFRHNLALKRHTDGSRLPIYCSKTCQGKWVATHHGFIAHPENITRGPGKGKSPERIALETLSVGEKVVLDTPCKLDKNHRCKHHSLPGNVAGRRFRSRHTAEGYVVTRIE